jgi:uncharacterized protein YndB with AHSA1/START domain
MSRNVIVRYRTRPDAAEENSLLVEAVLASLAELEPSGMAYTTYRLADGATFVHVAHFDGAENPLATLPAFAEFQRNLAERCVEPPALTEATVVGSYNSIGGPGNSDHRRIAEDTLMRSYQATAMIEAPPEQVWPALTDIAAWPRWDSGVTKVDGRLALGEKLSITVEANGRRAFPVKVVTLSEPDRMVFRGGMPLGLFTGERTYTLQQEGTGTRFTMREQYTGPLAGMIFKSIPNLAPSFQQFANGLKRQAEDPQPPTDPSTRR